VDKDKEPNNSKWYKTRMCWCDECRFFSEKERPVCPNKNVPDAVGIQLWASNAEMLGTKDYIDPLDSLPSPSSAYNGEVPIEERRSPDNNFTPDS
jgi:hypothetical protein